MTFYWTPTPTPVVTLLPTTTYGDLLRNTTTGHFNMFQLPLNAFAPYGFATQNILAIPIFIVLFAYYYTLWIRNGNLRMASIVGILIGFMFVSGGVGGLGVTMPSIVSPIIYGALAASISGFIMSMFKAA